MQEQSSSHQAIFQSLRQEIARHIVGQDHLVERLVIALLADGHVLLEGVPGLAKTRTLSVLTEAISAENARIQFTPDLLPSDLVGTEVYRPQSGEFVIRKGPVFTNLLLADEINRAPAKVQSALLQSMQEREVTIGEQTFKLPRPFLVLATQNPIEQEGTYPLPEAQLDRFLMKVKVDYPSYEEELKILTLVTKQQTEIPTVHPVMSLQQLEPLKRELHTVHVDDKIDEYIVSLVQATRQADKYGFGSMLDWGASPRASLALRTCAMAHAFYHGRSYVTPEDVKAIAPDVLRHRIIPSFEAEARGVGSDELVKMFLDTISVQ